MWFGKGFEIPEHHIVRNTELFRQLQATGDQAEAWEIMRHSGVYFDPLHGLDHVERTEKSVIFVDRGLSGNGCTHDATFAVLAGER